MDWGTRGRKRGRERWDRAHGPSSLRPRARAPGPEDRTRRSDPGLWRTAGLLAAACVALFVLIELTQGPDVVGYHHPSDCEKAEDDRSAAEESCARKDWAACKASLDEAATLDPAGESEPRVQQARDKIASATGGQRVEGGARGPGR